MTLKSRIDWPYPHWIAHRGAGPLAPENTLAAFRLGASHGYRMFECDAKLSADGVVFLLHDDDLDRTTSGRGLAGTQPWSTLSRLDAGGWHSPRWTGEPLCTLENLARWCLANRLMLNIEIKPTPGLEEETGRQVAALADALWKTAPDAAPPLLTSFRPESLLGAKAVAPGLPRGLLLDSPWPGWLEIARNLGCRAVVCDQLLWNPERVGAVRGAGMRCLAYTVNDDDEVRRLQGLGLDGLITDRVDRYSPA
ncbi:MAG TPA: glycerophosphodiester phosphodiesterase [Hydrogenophaga sp.]|uniref:glycerophosphodiester phosphodiesterase n=1 Tax=Hydrogenophaga sp. TaxID=1904254 RepID=UPI002C670913|nr:glycerophosphodiester phosphodiesterase [Hydrogenophaga sp.]HMN92539.1 glycerophosphodiester phosphodiesterase [Hydrogenophaga sp.]HMP11137.1 glycerophosphodiester phosphodiesterase [Hydrogenophaga sp.]